MKKSERVLEFTNLPARVIRVGNSLAFVIPAFAARDLGWKAGTEVSLEMRGKTLYVTGRENGLMKGGA